MRSNLGGRRHDKYYANRLESVSLAKELSPRPPRLAAACPCRPGDLDSARSAFPALYTWPACRGKCTRAPQRTHSLSAETARRGRGSFCFSFPRTFILLTLSENNQAKRASKWRLSMRSCARRTGGATLGVRTSAEEADVRAFRNGRPARRAILAASEVSRLSATAAFLIAANSGGFNAMQVARCSPCFENSHTTSTT